MVVVVVGFSGGSKGGGSGGSGGSGGGGHWCKYYLYSRSDAGVLNWWVQQVINVPLEGKVAEQI